MSDGPYRTLNMSPAWKAVAKRAANAAHTLEEVVEMLAPALLDDRKAVRTEFDKKIRALFGDGSQLVFVEVALAGAAQLRMEACNTMEMLLADQAIDAARQGRSGPAAYQSVLRACFEERVLARARQIEEHFQRRGSPAAGHLRAQLGSAIGRLDTATLAAGIAGGTGSRTLAPRTDHTGLDDGVRLP